MADRIDRTRITADASQFNAEMEASADKYMTESQRMASAMREAMQSVQGHTKNAADKVKQQGGEMSQMWSRVKGQIVAALAGAVSIGGITAAISKTVEYARESEKLARALGVSQTEASELVVALGDIYQSSEVLISANKAVMRAIREDEDAFKALGVATRDAATGGFRNALDIMLEVNQKLLSFKEGTDRNIEGQKIYKKSWEEISPVLQLTAGLMEGSRKKAADLNLALGAESVEAISKYRAAQNDAQDVTLALGKVVAEAVMPVITELFNDFAETGPEAIAALRRAMGHLITVFYAAKTAFTAVWEGIKLFAQGIGIAIGTMIEVAAAVATRDWGRAGRAIKNQFDSLKTAGTDAFKAIADEAEKNSQRATDAQERANASTKGTRTQRQGGGQASTGGEDKGKAGLVATLEAELAVERDAYERRKLEAGSFETYTRAMEAKFWQERIGLAKDGSAEQAAILKKYYEAERDVRKQAFEGQIAGIRLQIQQAKEGSSERIQLAIEEARRIGEKYGLESEQYKEASQRVLQQGQERRKQQEKLAEMALEREKEAQLSAIELERQAVEQAADLGFIKGEEKIRQLRALKEREYYIEMQAEMDKAAIYAESEVAYQQHLDRLAKLKEKHAVDMKKIDGDMAREQKRTLDSWLDPIGNAVQQMANGVLQGTQTMAQMFRNALTGMASQYLATLIKMGVEWVKVEILKTQATTAGAAARTTAEAGAAGTSSALNIGAAIKMIGIKAWEAAASVYAAIAAIPVVGPFLAPAMAVGAAATVMGFIGKIFSAAGGFDVPAGLSPFTQLHPKEMVLPADIAEPMRRNLAAGDSGGDTNVYISALDARSVADYFRSNSHTLSPALRRLQRKFTR